ncbi:LLM class flavin-dependent oxidoreductase [Jeotgalibacillus haloalkalitolerans]|uniref:LLM class flavin-dependent oxidoreductase n=1 Tax=Jeotgalibacillus haloalkalitolerans TaxID=3104292 RepID=A0ABU5KI47_9BACL|nr:LLM class flavin-dependent oxidoreductase [Jeotgalibacillus sp. HH7-29]MDZ5710867.1 LLM class flavin-dependent oxidoreductase [Jeotgalibacillus sp. HH7-29]
MKLGILDQVPMPQGSDPSDVLNDTIELAKSAEKLGYQRYWLAEHHNTNGLLSAAPEILMTRIASATEFIKVGSGGILLPQYSPLKVAETFKTIEALFPGRVDLGVGRSPGGTERTRAALTDSRESMMSAFPRHLDELYGFLHNELPKQHEYRMVKVTPRTGSAPPIWVLGLSPRSAKLAAERGLGLTFGHFINPDKWEETLRVYREHFKPGQFDEPTVNVCVFTVCAETQEEAERLALTQDMWLLSIEKGDSQVHAPERLKEQGLTSADLEKIRHNRRRMIVGTPEKVKTSLEELSERYQTDDFLLITNIYSPEDKKKSYELIAREMI